jgi:dienelactone hydrolase
VNNSAKAQKELDVIRNNWLQYTDAPNSLYHFLTGEAFKLLDYRAEKVAKLKTKDDLLKRQAELKKAMWKDIGSFPEKTPLNAKITNSFKKDGYQVENIIYESFPGFYVTASLFIPDNVKKPAPAILFCSGHSQIAYRRELYQLPLINLVKKGFIVLAIDPIGQGERSQYNPDDADSLFVNSSTKQHSYPSTQVLLTGKSIARYFIWDGIRGIDYLVSRKEVDPTRIGVHGLSGGGTQTVYISALDDRVVASAPAGYITSYKRLFESVGAQDGEQNFYHGISDGIDHGDFVEVRAPKPTLIMATTRDFFSIQGARETYAEAKGIYRLLGKPDNVEMTEDDFEHGYTRKNREAMYAFFQKFLKLPGSPIEEDVEYLTAKELQKTPTGQLLTSLGGETVFSLNRKDAGELVKKLQASRKDIDTYIPGVLKSAKQLSGYREPIKNNEPVFTGRFQRNGYVIEKYFVKGEGDYVIPYLLIVPDKPNNKALIYLHSSGKAAEAMQGGEIEWFVQKGFTVLAPDLLGIGEMGPGVFRGDAFIGSISYNLLYTSTLIGRSILGVMAGDVVRLTNLLKKRKGINNIYGFAKKELAPVLLHAAAFDKDIERIALIEPYSSYESLVMNHFYRPKFVNGIVPGALTAYDLPDLAASLVPRKLMMINTTDANGSSTDIEGIEKALEPIRTAYRVKQSGKLQLNIASLKPGEKLDNLFMEWIK